MLPISPRDCRLGRPLLLLLALTLAACVPASRLPSTQATPATKAAVTGTAAAPALEATTPPAIATGTTEAAATETEAVPTVAATTPAPSGNPRIELTASAASLQVGESVTLTAVNADIGLPYYTVTLTDAGSADPSIRFVVTYDNQLKPELAASRVVELVSASGEQSRAVVVLRALAAGSVQAQVSATGEVLSNGAYIWGGGGSEPLTLLVNP